MKNLWSKRGLLALACVGVVSVTLLGGDGSSDAKSATSEPAAPIPEPITSRRLPLSVSTAAAALRATLPAGFLDIFVAQTAEPEQVASIAPPPPEDIGPEIRNLTVTPGDTMMDLLTGTGIDRSDAYSAITAMSKVMDPRRIRPGQEITVALLDEQGDGEPVLDSLSIAVAYDKEVQVARLDDGFKAKEVSIALTHELVRAEGVIESSLYEAAAAAQVPAAVIVDLIRTYSWDVDFQRDIRSGDRFSILYEQVLDDKGQRVATGEIQFANLNLSGTENPIYRFQAKNGDVEYFDDKGRSVEKALLRTPIDGARLSSGFGKRTHPVLGYTKMHAGVDFAAPTGTPIYAAGNGAIEVAGWQGSYGKYVRIRHIGNYKTAYAHMSRIAKGIAAGGRVKQGQIIGYVGTTGRSTGAHLHYEILRGDKKVNPLRVKMPSGRSLKGTELAAFDKFRKGLDQQFADLGQSPAKMASSNLPN